MSIFIRYPFMGYILSRINFRYLEYKLTKHEVQRIVLLEYTHSRSLETIFQSEYIPNTKVFVNDVLTHEFLEELNKLIGLEDTGLYVRRKIVNGEVTSTRQLIMYYNPYGSMPPLVRQDYAF